MYFMEQFLDLVRQGCMGRCYRKRELGDSCEMGVGKEPWFGVMSQGREV